MIKLLHRLTMEEDEKMFYMSPAYDILELSFGERRRNKCQKEVIRSSSYTDLLRLCRNRQMMSIILSYQKSWQDWKNMT